MREERETVQLNLECGTDKATRLVVPGSVSGYGVAAREPANNLPGLSEVESLCLSLTTDTKTVQRTLMFHHSVV